MKKTKPERRRRPFHLAIRDWPGAVRIGLAVLCLLVGLAGIILPILPGWPFLFVGLAILAPPGGLRRRSAPVGAEPAG